MYTYYVYIITVLTESIIYILMKSLCPITILCFFLYLYKIKINKNNIVSTN